ncbi:MAG: hypothetical protein AAFO94_17060, partial [Bacteroidota bacterium]
STAGFKIKHSVVLFIIGWIMTMLGSLFKIQSWPLGSELLTVGTVIKVLAVIFFAIKVIGIKDPRSFLNQ